MRLQSHARRMHPVAGGARPAHHVHAAAGRARASRRAAHAAPIVHTIPRPLLALTTPSITYHEVPS